MERNGGRDFDRIGVETFRLLQRRLSSLGRTEQTAPSRSFVRVDVVVDATASYPGLARPRVDIRARLAGLHVPHAALVPEVADSGVVALLRPVLRRFKRNFG